MPFFWRLTGIYLLAMVGTAVALFLVDIGLSAAAGFQLGSGGTAVSLLVPAMVAGQSFRRRTGRLHRSGEAWVFALWFVVLQTIMSVPLVLLLVPDFGPVSRDMPAILAFLTIFMFVIGVPVTRLFFGMGAKNTDKALSRA